MPETPTRYNVLIASPGDVREDAFAVAEGLSRWSSITGQRLSIDIHPLLWEKDAVPETGRSPQTAIDEQLVDRADLTIALFGQRVGTPINGYASGTVAEIKRSLEQKKPVSVYFGPVKANVCNIDLAQLIELHKFAEWCKSQSLHGEYQNTFQLCEQIQHHIPAQVIELHHRRQAEITINTQAVCQNIIGGKEAIIKDWADLTETQQQQYKRAAINEMTDLGFTDCGENATLTRARSLHLLDKRVYQEAKEEIAASKPHLLVAHSSVDAQRALRRLPGEHSKQ